MGKHKKYTINNIYDMALIPREALPRFLAELALVIEEIRPLCDLYKNGIVEQKSFEWTDDKTHSIQLTFEPSEATNAK